MRLLPFDYAVRNLGRSRARMVLTMVGSGLVVVLVVTAAAFVRGMDQALRATGERDNVIVIGAGSEESLERSEVNASVASLLSASITGIRHRAGVDYVSPEVQVQLPLRIRADQPNAPIVMVRGITPAACLVHASVQVIAGRLPNAGADEVMIGGTVSIKMGVSKADLGLEKSIYIDKRPFRIVGHFVAPGTVTEAEVWMPLTDVKQITKRTTDSCVIVTLDTQKAEFGDIATFTKMRPDLELAATTETAYFAKLSSFFAPIRLVAWVTACLIAVGGLFGGLNTMYAAFVSRVRELGTLQSLGFRRLAIVISLVQESTLATAVGALMASAVGLFLLDGIAIRFSRGTFGLTVDAPVLGVALAAGVALGLFGALPPAWHCLRMAIPDALKSI
ncbi:MAG: ABC transporter permease [Planctomycetes bacterium]|nr:ABC transporter permease [Planctomycetota bacterium]